MKHFVTTFYKFKPLTALDKIKSDVETTASELDIKGLVIFGHEGINSTIAANSLENLEKFKLFIREYFNLPDLAFKDSESDVAPFRRFKMKARPEIVSLHTPELVPQSDKNHHLTPEQWNKVLKEEDVLIIDTRNWYETKIGTFKGAINPMTDKFSEFPKFIEQQGYDKDKKILIFCTGGIRCEKGILEMQRQGYNNVYQLDGGIIKYIEEFPNDQFEGECFIFDHRVALDQNLKPTKTYKLCPHCGQPGNRTIDCKRCDTHAVICENCAKLQWAKDTCSKNCAYQYKMQINKKGQPQVVPFNSEKTQML